MCCANINFLCHTVYLEHSCSLSGGAFWKKKKTFAEGAAGDRRDQTKGWQHHALKRLRFVLFVLLCLFLMLLWGTPHAKEENLYSVGGSSLLQCTVDDG